MVLQSADAGNRWPCSNPSPAAYLLWDSVSFINITISLFLFSNMDNYSTFLKRLMGRFNFTNIYKVLKIMPGKLQQ